MEKYFFILGVENDSSKEQIKKAYRALARVCHPDAHVHNPDIQQVAGMLFVRITEAYDQLSEINSRAHSAKPDDQPSRRESRREANEERSYRDTTERSVHGSDLLGPAKSEKPSGFFRVGGTKFRFLFGGTAMLPSPGGRMPSWKAVKHFADTLEETAHKCGKTYYYTLMEKNHLLVLKFVTESGGAGYTVVYRCHEGKYWSTSNDPSRRWQSLSLAQLNNESWIINQAKIIVEIVRPNLNEDDADRELDYRFRFEELTGSASSNNSSDSNSNNDSSNFKNSREGCPACGSLSWDGLGCPKCNFYLY